MRVVTTLITLIIVLTMLPSCAILRNIFGEYKDGRYFYEVEGVQWECREPQPWRGGNCQTEATWILEDAR